MEFKLNSNLIAGLGPLGIMRKPSEGLAIRRPSAVSGERRSSGILANLPPHQEETNIFILNQLNLNQIFFPRSLKTSSVFIFISQESLLRDTFSVLRARKGSMYPRGPQVLEEDEEDDDEVEDEEKEGEVKEKPSTGVEVKSEKAAVRLETGRKASEEECDVAEALATWKRRREERLER